MHFYGGLGDGANLRENPRSLWGCMCSVLAGTWPLVRGGGATLRMITRLR